LFRGREQLRDVSARNIWAVLPAIFPQHRARHLLRADGHRPQERVQAPGRRPRANVPARRYGAHPRASVRPCTGTGSQCYELGFPARVHGEFTARRVPACARVRVL
jgi:hypothetical protein